MPSGRLRASEAKSFSELPSITKAGSVRLSIYLYSDTIANLDKIRNMMGGAVKPGPSSVIQYLAADYLRQNKEVVRLNREIVRLRKLAEGTALAASLLGGNGEDTP